VATAAGEAASEAHEAFKDAAQVLEHWILMKEGPEDVELREGPSL